MNLLGFSIQKTRRVVKYVPTKPTTRQELTSRVAMLEDTAGQLKPPHDHDEHLDKSRSKIALKFVRWYLFYVLLIIVGVPWYNAVVAQSKEALDLFKILAQVGTLLGTPLGFVVGYYFKEDSSSSK